MITGFLSGGLSRWRLSDVEARFDLKKEHRREQAVPGWLFTGAGSSELV
jgi:hypothetical protein